jgi:hypothetical protein
VLSALVREVTVEALPLEMRSASLDIGLTEIGDTASPTCAPADDGARRSENAP